MKRLLAFLPFVCGVHPVLESVDAQQPTRTTSRAFVRGKVLAIGNLTYTEIDALDRDRTLFLLPVGMLEEHGPHLPIASDLIGVDHEVGHVAKRVSRSLPGWNVVVMPTINYGAMGANELNGVPIHPGTYAIRQSTLRAVVADIGAQIVRNRFKWVFVMNGHGAPAHHIAVNEAADFVSETFNATMLNVSALLKADSAMRAKGLRIEARHFSPAELSAIGFDPHAGVSETSWMLAVRPDLVRQRYRTLPNVRAESVAEMRAIAERPGWEGYFSSPSQSTAAYGRDIEAWWIDGTTALILRAVRGENMLRAPRFPGNVESDSAVVQTIRRSAEAEREFELQLQRWLAQRTKEE